MKQILQNLKTVAPWCLGGGISGLEPPRHKDTKNPLCVGDLVVKRWLFLMMVEVTRIFLKKLAVSFGHRAGKNQLKILNPMFVYIGSSIPRIVQEIAVCDG
jgi:hypothetical protein